MYSNIIYRHITCWCEVPNPAGQHTVSTCTEHVLWVTGKTDVRRSASFVMMCRNTQCTILWTQKTYFNVVTEQRDKNTSKLLGSDAEVWREREKYARPHLPVLITRANLHRAPYKIVRLFGRPMHMVVILKVTLGLNRTLRMILNILKKWQTPTTILNFLRYFIRSSSLQNYLLKQIFPGVEKTLWGKEKREMHEDDKKMARKKNQDENLWGRGMVHKPYNLYHRH